jgi:hypothetical protein
MKVEEVSFEDENGKGRKATWLGSLMAVDCPLRTHFVL